MTAPLDLAVIADLINSINHAAKSEPDPGRRRTLNRAKAALLADLVRADLAVVEVCDPDRSLYSIRIRSRRSRFHLPSWTTREFGVDLPAVAAAA